MRSATPVAVAPQADLDSIAYGPPAAPPAAVVVGSGGGAIGALRSAFAAPRPVVYAASAPVAYVAPMPVRYDSSYHLVCRLLLEKKKNIPINVSSSLHI